MLKTTPSFPVYIVSKGRWESRITARVLDTIGVPYHMVVEQAEYEAYAAVIDPTKLLILDPAYQDAYETLDALGATKSKGPGPARNFAWDHSIANGAPWHWVMDDNIQGFIRLNRNLKVWVGDGTVFACMEDFVLRYENVAMAGPNYDFFAPRKEKVRPLILNTRIYSCNLIRNDLPFRWRGRYNEDTDLSLRILKAGLCTVQFNAFLQKKVMTQVVPGGNTAEFYASEGTLPKSTMLVNTHPDVASHKRKFGRDHHFVDYRPFRRNKLIRRADVEVPAGVNDYGMVIAEGRVDRRKHPQLTRKPPK